MTTKALSLVEEFIRSPQPQLRKNALTALAVINEPKAIELMTSVALEDSDAGVRQRAEDELFKLHLHSDAIGLAFTRLRSPDEETQQRAYAFLGRLRSKSATEIPLSIPWRDRLKLAARMNAYLYPKRSWRLRLRLWKPGLAGILLGSVFPVAFALRHFLDIDPYRTPADRIVQISFGLAVLVVVGIVLIVFAGQRTTPIYRHPNRFAAGVVETATTGFLGLVSVTPIFVLALIWQWLEGFSLGSLFIPLAGLMVGFVRVGTILSFGIFSARRTNRIAEVFGGAAIGSLAFVVVIVLIFKASGDTKLAFEWLVAAWLVHLPLAFGAANAFASVDKEALPSDVIVLLDRWRRLRAVILLAAFLFSVGLNSETLKRIADRLHRSPTIPGGTSP
jgi:hypothetical protein